MSILTTKEKEEPDRNLAKNCRERKTTTDMQFT